MSFMLNNGISGGKSAKEFKTVCDGNEKSSKMLAHTHARA